MASSIESSKGKNVSGIHPPAVFLSSIASIILHKIAHIQVKQFERQFHSKPCTPRYSPFQVFVHLISILVVDIIFIRSFGQLFLFPTASCLAKLVSMTVLTQPVFLLSDFCHFYLEVFHRFLLSRNLSLKTKNWIENCFRITCNSIASTNMLVFAYYVLRDGGTIELRYGSNPALLLLHCISQLLFSLFNVWKSITEIYYWQEENVRYIAKRSLIYTVELNKDCSICLEGMSGQNVKQLSCGHCYHEKCILSWLNYKLACPICRHEIL